jgi:hypothetical protein
MANHSYRDTLKQPGLRPFLWTQLLGAFNDNLFKIVSMFAVHLVAAARAGRELSIRQRGSHPPVSALLRIRRAVLPTSIPSGPFSWSANRSKWWQPALACSRSIPATCN